LSLINLTLLGLVIPQPISAYDLAKFVLDHELQEIVRLSIPAIYKNLKKLEEQGYLSAKEIRQGEMPEKTIYSVTANGRQLFYDLMDKYAEEEIKYHFDFNHIVVNLDKLPAKKGLRLATRLKTRLEKRKEDMLKEKQLLSTVSRTGAVLFSQVQHVNQALLQWIDELISTLSK
jgi:DNA-binding PadR family transcriptional regulator